MMVRGGGDPRQAWLARRLREWACRLGALPPMRMTASWFGSAWNPPNTSVWRDVPRLMASSPRIIYCPIHSPNQPYSPPRDRRRPLTANPAQGPPSSGLRKAAQRRAGSAGDRTQRTDPDITRSLSRWVHRDLPRAAPPDSWRSLRSARVPPVHYLDKPHRPSLGVASGTAVTTLTAKAPYKPAPAKAGVSVPCRT
jgi:hypothetical protein